MQFKVYCILRMLFDTCFPDTHPIQRLRHSYIVILYALSKYTSSPSFTASLQRCLVCSFQIHIQIRVYCIPTTLLSTFFPNTHPIQGLLHSYNFVWYVLSKYTSNSMFTAFATLFDMFFPHTHPIQDSLHCYNVF